MKTSGDAAGSGTRLGSCETGRSGAVSGAPARRPPRPPAAPARAWPPTWPEKAGSGGGTPSLFKSARTARSRPAHNRARSSSASRRDPGRGLGGLEQRGYISAGERPVGQQRRWEWGTQAEEGKTGGGVRRTQPGGT